MLWRFLGRGEDIFFTGVSVDGTGGGGGFWSCCWLSISVVLGVTFRVSVWLLKDSFIFLFVCMRMKNFNSQSLKRKK